MGWTFGNAYRSEILLLIYPLHGRNTKKQKTKTADFFVKHSYFSQNIFKKAKIIIYFFMKNLKKTILS